MECNPDCKYKKLLEECEGKRQQENTTELHKCRERHKVKDKKLKALNKKVLTLTIIATMLEGFNIGGGSSDTVGVFPAPSTVAVFALYPFICGTRKRKRR